MALLHSTIWFIRLLGRTQQLLGAISPLTVSAGSWLNNGIQQTQIALEVYQTKPIMPYLACVAVRTFLLCHHSLTVTDPHEAE
uniref:Uncharacterized protein n=1 Tax=Salmonella sp. TaxID=599 RepID=A0A482EW86_SALSP|nr:hypothetical protein NNIBIDOC_00223 [Salmonella sp.]